MSRQIFKGTVLGAVLGLCLLTDVHEELCSMGQFGSLHASVNHGY